MYARLRQIADLMDQANTEGCTADQAEAQAVEQIRHLGRDLMSDWAVEICEQLLRLSRRGAQLRPFCLAAGVTHQGYSRPLQRVLADFGAEASFQAAPLRVKEH